ncbi:hypothetical protein ACFSKL_09410 [Belliella marina]|uniref:DUF5007 domain-containing protein n=1 Tax=Belliella marina TaxID=1644146 RepID=A0ABW4VP03_9BACT
MRLTYVNICSVLLAVFVLTACAEVPEGFISDNIFYSQNPFYVPQGRVVTSNTIQGDGSTLPLKVIPTEIRNKVTGEVVNDLFFKEYSTSVYTSSISKTDTYESINEKVSEKLMPIFSVVESGGSMLFSNQTFNIPVGEYTMDVEVSNGAGTRVVKDICTIIIHEANPLPDVHGGASAFRTVKDEEGKDVVQEIFFGFGSSTEWDSSGENKVTFKFVDKDGEVINPSKYGFQEQRISDGYKFSDSTPWDGEVPSDVSDTKVSYSYPVTPFPYSWIEPWRNFGFSFSPTGDVAKEFEAKAGFNSFNVRINSYMKFNLPGTYNITIKCDFIDI